MEVWKTIQGASRYEVSTHGNVRNSITGVVRKKNPRNRHGMRPSIRLTCDDGRERTFDVHRLVAVAFVPNPENKPLALHRDGVLTNNHYANLYWGTPRDNFEDMRRHGRDWAIFKPGSRNIQARLDGLKVLAIRAMLDLGLSHRVIAERIGVARRTVGDVANGVTWQLQTEC